MSDYEVHLSVERARGCGYRKPSKGGVGIYVMAGGPGDRCGRLPFLIEVCVACGEGVKPSRSWTWITPSILLTKDQLLDVLAGDSRPCDIYGFPRCNRCPVGGGIPEGKHGLLWIGEQHYKTPAEYMNEGRAVGVSRKISAVLRGFRLGEHWVYLAHRSAVTNGDPDNPLPGIFTAFKPSHIDLVIEDERKIPDKAKKLKDKLGDGARIVKVVRDIDRQATLDGVP